VHDGDAVRWAQDIVRERTRGRVVDVGCGEGRFLPPRGIGVDLDAARVAAARADSPLVAVADAHALPFADAAFDTAYAHRMLNDARRIDHALAEIVRVLRRDGRLLIFTRARPGGGDRLDRENGERRLRPFFERVETLLYPGDDRAALFIADGPRTATPAARHTGPPMTTTHDERLVVVTPEPFNAETPLEEQRGIITPAPIHYVRNHFPIPRWDHLAVEGEVERPLRLGLEDLASLPTRSLVVTLECAGNGRSFVEPPVPGEQWRLGAVGTAEWTGVPLRHVLERARISPKAVEVLFAGADRGTAGGKQTAFERSLPVDRALDGDVILAFAMNGEPLPPDHGAPLRLVVPRMYGMASVKWLARIVAIDRRFRGWFQLDRYSVNGEPLPAIAPRAVITSPRDGVVVARPMIVRGYCWSGRAPIARVEVSDDGGGSWSDAEIEPPVSPYAWRRWQHRWEPRGPGDATLMARAWTTDGECQPLEPQRTDLGYMNNGARPVAVRIGAPT